MVDLGPYRQWLRPVSREAIKLPNQRALSSNCVIYMPVPKTPIHIILVLENCWRFLSVLFCKENLHTTSYHEDKKHLICPIPISSRVICYICLHMAFIICMFILANLSHEMGWTVSLVVLYIYTHYIFMYCIIMRVYIVPTVCSALYNI